MCVRGKGNVTGSVEGNKSGLRIWKWKRSQKLVRKKDQEMPWLNE